MGGHSEHLDKKYGVVLKVGENIRDMRKKFLRALNKQKLDEQIKNQASSFV